MSGQICNTKKALPKYVAKYKTEIVTLTIYQQNTKQIVTKTPNRHGQNMSTSLQEISTHQQNETTIQYDNKEEEEKGRRTMMTTMKEKMRTHDDK